MEKFESVFDAVRHIKNNLPVDQHEVIFLMYRDIHDRVYVSTDEDDLEKKISEDFYSWGYEDGDPEIHAERYTIWSYVLAENKSHWSTLYQKYNRCPLSKNHIRGKANTSGEIIASFSVEKW